MAKQSTEPNVESQGTNQYDGYDTLSAVEWCTPIFLSSQICCLVRAEKGNVTLTLIFKTPLGVFTKTFTFSSDISITWQLISRLKVTLSVSNLNVKEDIVSFDLRLKPCVDIPVFGWKCFDFSHHFVVPTIIKGVENDIDDEQFSTLLGLNTGGNASEAQWLQGDIYNSYLNQQAGFPTIPVVSCVVCPPPTGIWPVCGSQNNTGNSYILTWYNGVCAAENNILSPATNVHPMCAAQGAGVSHSPYCTTAETCLTVLCPQAHAPAGQVGAATLPPPTVFSCPTRAVFCTRVGCPTQQPQFCPTQIACTIAACPTQIACTLVSCQTQMHIAQGAFPTAEGCPTQFCPTINCPTQTCPPNLAGQVDAATNRPTFFPPNCSPTQPPHCPPYTQNCYTHPPVICPITLPVGCQTAIQHCTPHTQHCPTHQPHCQTMTTTVQPTWNCPTHQPHCQTMTTTVQPTHQPQCPATWNTCLSPDVAGQTTLPPTMFNCATQICNTILPNCSMTRVNCVTVFCPTVNNCPPKTANCPPKTANCPPVSWNCSTLQDCQPYTIYCPPYTFIC